MRRMFYRCARASLVALAAAALSFLAVVLSSPAEAQSAPQAFPPSPADATPDLFSPLSSPRTVAHTPHATLRGRAVKVDFGALGDVVVGRLKFVRLNLFDDTSFTGVVDRVVQDKPGMFSCFGHLAEDDLGEFSLVLNKDVVVGIVRSPRRNGVYSIWFSPEQVHVVRQLIPGDFGVCGNGPGGNAAAPTATAPTATALTAAPTVAEPTATEPLRARRSSSGDASCGDDGPLAVLVLYTDITRAAAGGTNAMEAEVQQAIDTSNTAYSNSQVPLRMRLVHTEEVTYAENGTFQNHLDRLISTNDGILDNAHTLRDRYGADTVVLIVEDDDSDQPQSLCGLGSQMTTLSDDFKAQAFAIVNRGCASSNFSFVHEVGHNLGCDHDRANAGSSQLYTYAFGYQFTGQKPNYSRWRTVMAYNGSPSSTRVGYFSNPSVSFDGTSTGIAPGQPGEADNALVLNNTTLTATNWRRDTMWVQIGWGGTQTGCPGRPYAAFFGGVDAVPWTGTVVMRAGTTNAVGTITKPMTITSSGGLAVIGKQ